MPAPTDIEWQLFLRILSPLGDYLDILTGEHALRAHLLGQHVLPTGVSWNDSNISEITK